MPHLRAAALGRASLDDLVHAALVEYPRYVDPETGVRCEVERVLDWMGLQRRQRERFAPAIQAVAFSDWKQPIAQLFMAGSSLRFVEAPEPLAAEEVRAVWGCRIAAAARATGGSGRCCASRTASCARSVSARTASDRFRGSSTAAACTTTRRRRPTSSNCSQTAPFDAAMLARARALRDAIVSAGITKYNVGAGRWQRPAGRRRVILVPGQVESDASIALGAPGVRTNLGLLRAARERNPGAYLVFKPHPDVLAGVRDGDPR